jgi:hypothetical protein
MKPAGSIADLVETVLKFCITRCVTRARKNAQIRDYV